MSYIDFSILSLIFLIANIVEAVSGFGSVIISVTLGSIFFDINFLLPVIVPLNIILSIYLVTKYFQYIDKIFLLKNILPFMGSGLLIGIYIFNVLEGNLLKKIYGIVIIILSSKELYFYFTNKQNSIISKSKSNLFIFLSGLMQGIYASGGPLLVYGLSSMKFTKTVFRSNLSIIWLISNSILIINYYNNGNFNYTSIKYTTMLAPIIILGIFLGEKIHNKINEVTFKKVVYILLLIAGTFLTIRT
ncbi:MAG: hypothetical protein KatS3mg068_2443 [Candidatus Sericytochromatia bacterium]|nr:MAG: hypothetical protein KatS3mg068_2443 [Candidatus Sericytochromatia bacterium]